MLRKAVVVEHRSQFKCWHCHSESSDLPFCPQCGKLKAPENTLTHFEILGFPVQPELDAEVLRAKFYELSKKTHPDRFAASTPPESSYALGWSTKINRAYQTLRDPISRTYYLLELFKVPESGKSVPLELAETYFELQ